MREFGRSEEEILNELRSLWDRRIPYERVFSSMCTRPHPVAVKAFMLYIESNLGDFGIFPAVKELEDRVVEMTADMLNLNGFSGYMTSGGTEANIQALRAFRNLKGKGNFIAPESRHFSIDKAADVLGVEMRLVPLNDEYQMDVSCLEEMIDDETFGIVALLGSTELGQIDPLDEISKIASEHGIPLHVDGAFGAFVVPFLYPDFRFPEHLSSVSGDPHKMGMSVIPSGVLLFSDEEFLEALKIETPYLTTRHQYSLPGTRPGASAAATYAVMEHLGRRGYRKIVEKCMRNTRVLIELMSELEFYPAIEPKMNVVVFKTDEVDRIRKELMKRRWLISKSFRPLGMRFVIMPHVEEENLKLFVEDLKRIL
ncbi:MAG: tyrosine decarboxylase / aspartate 1-decarboxylase [Archaeoglobi archaeon]|nr:tyrosine decarboxylase MfnA [Candidatus Mnemosynella bozhongmuii]MDI3502011.1 tyrosine decarboxylase / aspartate 1-decarboxylase [Archaeoglobi archaeon]MDK2781531.1 tyrosine decarboxylase / aspartate 1-decarboxylase [Archaeoglobi archaeon]